MLPCGPDGPGGPWPPVRPLGPVSPTAPEAPGGPLLPTAPLWPLRPGTPRAPFGPGGPETFDTRHLQIKVVHGSISCDPTQPNTANNGAYSLVVTYFCTQNLSVSRTCQIGRKIKFNCLVKPNLI